MIKSPPTHRKLKSSGSQMLFIKPGFNLKNLEKEETLQIQRKNSEMNLILGPKPLLIQS